MHWGNLNLYAVAGAFFKSPKSMKKGENIQLNIYAVLSRKEKKHFYTGSITITEITYDATKDLQ